MMIRAVQPADLPEITAIYDQAVTHGTASFELTPPGLAEMARRHDALVQSGFPYLVAVEEHVLGYAYAGPYRPRPAYRATVENSVYVDTAAQKRGVGKALLSALIQDAADKDFRQMIAVIGDSANAASIALHRAAGFDHIGTFQNVGFKHGRWLDSVLMQRSLGYGANKAL